MEVLSIKTTFDENKAKETLEKGIPEATATLKDEQKTKKLISNLEKS